MKLTISLIQSNVSDSFHMRLPIYAEIDGGYRYLGLLGVTGTKPLETTLKLSQRPDKVLLDPHRSILAEINQ